MFLSLKNRNKKTGDKDSLSKGFTLIELMVSVSIFAIVLVVAIGAILTVIDSNRKAQTLTSVMNNLNFSMESMTRSIKTGLDITVNSSSQITIQAIDLSQSSGFTRQSITYKLEDGAIKRRIGSGNFIAITAPDVNIENLSFTLLPNPVEDYEQPRVFVTISGTVSLTGKESQESRFTIQTSISQRKLNLDGDE